jgi:hypothetical protein
VGRSCPVCAATLMSDNSCRLCYYKEKTPVSIGPTREDLEKELDDLIVKAFKLCNEDKIKFIVNLCGDEDTVLECVLNNALDLYDCDSYDDIDLEHWVNRVKNGYISVYNEKVDKIILEEKIPTEE